MSSPQASSRSRRPALVRIGGEGSPLWVHSFAPDARRFIGLFGATIGRIPSTVFATLATYWFPGGPESPRINLAEQPIIFTRNGQCGGIAMSESAGRVFHFAGPAIDVIEEELGQCLVAHELAHAHTDAELSLGLLHPSERAAYQGALSDQPELIRLREEYADARLFCWGFNPEAIRKWCGEYLRQRGYQ